MEDEEILSPASPVGVDDEDEINEEDQALKTEALITSRSKKDEMIGRLLARWWYVLPDWPPPDHDYGAELRRRKLKQVAFDQWELADDVDGDGMTKVYEITHFPGVFRDAQGNAIDLRPAEGKPCYKFLSTKYSEKELGELLRVALTKQISEAKDSPYLNTDAKYINRLTQELNRLLREEY